MSHTLIFLLGKVVEVPVSCILTLIALRLHQEAGALATLIQMRLLAALWPETVSTLGPRRAPRLLLQVRVDSWPDSHTCTVLLGIS